MITFIVISYTDMRQQVLTDLCKTMQGINCQTKPSWGFTYPIEIVVNVFLYFFFFCMFGNLHSPEWQRSLKIPSLLGNYHTDRFAHHYPWYFGASHSLIGRIQCCRCDRLFCCLQWPALGKDCLLSFRTPLCIVFTGLLILAGLWLLTEYIRV